MATDPTTTGRHAAAGEHRPRWRFAPPGRWTGVAEHIAAIRLRLATTFEREIDAGRGFLWLPVAFGIGVLVYFGLPSEPWTPALVALAGGLALAAWRARRGVVAFRVLLMACAVAAGLCAAKIRTDWWRRRSCHARWS